MDTNDYRKQEAGFEMEMGYPAAGVVNRYDDGGNCGHGVGHGREALRGGYEDDKSTDGGNRGRGSETGCE